MEIHCNAGTTSTNQVGDLSGYGTVWYHPDGIANILSLSRVKEQGYRVTYDSDGGNYFKVEKADGTSRTFRESKRGLYFLDTAGPTHDNDGIVLVDTVADNRSTNYTNRAYSRASQARKIQQIVGRPSTREYMQIVERNLLPNCPITRDDIVAAERIFGPDVGILKGKNCSQRNATCRAVQSDHSIRTHVTIQRRRHRRRYHVHQQTALFRHYVPKHQVFNCRTSPGSEGRHARR